MAEVIISQTAEGVSKLTGTGDFAAMAGNWGMSHVIMWDCGPPEPQPPKRPKPPKGTEGDPEYDLALVEFREQLGEYELALQAYKQAKLDYAAFQKRYGGPYEIPMWSADANDALDRDQRAVKEGRQAELRYFISSKTRGYEKLKNGGLPKGKEPGHGQAENLRREAESNSELAAAMRADPVFGEQEIHR
jgi:hypothetical protein